MYQVYLVCSIALECGVEPIGEPMLSWLQPLFMDLVSLSTSKSLFTPKTLQFFFFNSLSQIYSISDQHLFLLLLVVVVFCGSPSSSSLSSSSLSW
ncbi:unnamed protein product [Lathyrus sativus]|nr:unnamed protein product [Lathyrus sativus]